MKPTGGALEMLDEAFHLLRRLPASLLACYVVGLLPYLLAFQLFWMEMSQSPFAADRAVPWALAVALAYLWMWVWHAVFAGGVRTMVAGGQAVAWTPGRMLSLVLTTVPLAAFALVAIPLSIAIVIPSTFTYALFQHAASHSVGEEPLGFGKVLARAGRAAAQWPGQNLVISLLLGVSTVLLQINLLAAAFFVPQLIRMFTGIETEFTRAPLSLFNSSLTLMIGMSAYYAVDIYAKVVYAIRDFRIDAVQTGEDLSVRLRLSPAILAVLAGLLWCAPYGWSQQTTPSSSAATPVFPADLDRSLDRLEQQPEFAWRTPRQVASKAANSWLDRFMDGIFAWIRTTANQIGRFFGRLIEEFLRWLRLTQSRSPGGGGVLSPEAAMTLIYLFVAVLAGAVGFLIFRIVQARAPRRKQAIPAAAPVIDLADENVTADQLPEVGWMDLADEWVGKGDYRMASRALYLAVLAHLADRGLLSLHRAKSNGEYARELDRRARTIAGLADHFRACLRQFEAGWFGRHALAAASYGEYQTRLKALREMAMRSDAA